MGTVTLDYEVLHRFIVEMGKELEHIYWMRGFSRDDAKKKAAELLLRAMEKTETALS